MNCPECGKGMEHGFFVVPYNLGISLSWQEDNWSYTGTNPRESIGRNPILHETRIEANRCMDCGIITMLLKSEKNSFTPADPNRTHG